MMLLLLLLLDSITAQLYASCGEIITEYMENALVTYEFSINDSYRVNFDTCNSEMDLIITVMDDLGNDISASQCNGGDLCGLCNNDVQHTVENFTISMPAGAYTILLEDYYFFGGDFYELKLKCTSSNVTTTIPSTTSVSSVTKDSSNGCEYHTNQSYTIAASQTIFDSILIQNNTISIAFDLRIDDYCNVSLCNIFQIDNDLHIASISLSVNGIQNYFEISIKNEFNFNDEYKIPNANQLLPMDSQYHRFYLTYTYLLQSRQHNENLFQVDEFETYYYSTSSIFASKLKPYKLYISNSFDNTMNGTVSNICIDSFVSTEQEIPCTECMGEIKCGDELAGQLTSASDINYYYFHPSNNLLSILFDSCLSSYDTHLYLYDIDFNVLFEADDEGMCGSQAKLFIDLLSVAEYILGISGYGTMVNHVFGSWSISVVCDEITWPCDACIGEIKCGETLVSEFTDKLISNFYYFNLTNNRSVTFDSCTSYYQDTNLRLYDMNWTLLYYNDDARECSTQAKLSISHLFAGEYILELRGPLFGWSWDEWKVDIACNDMSFHQMICNEIMYGYLVSSSNIDTYYYNLTDNSSSVTFNCYWSKNSNTSILLILFDLNSNVSYEGSCNNRLTFNSLDASEYILEVGDGFIGRYDIEIICGDDPKYKLVTIFEGPISTNLTFLESINWFDAEMYCEQQFGTTLGTVITDEDLNAVSVFPDALFLRLWIGMYRDIVNDSKWQWTDGTRCNYTTTGDCIDDRHWHPDQPDNLVQIELKQMGAYLQKSLVGHHDIEIYDQSFTWGQGVKGFLCNAPYTGYIPAVCTNTVNCWHKINCCRGWLYSEPAFTSYHEPAIAYYDSKLFVAGVRQIHYIDIEIWNDNVGNTWNYTEYHDDLSTSIDSQRYAQYGSSLWLWVYNPVSSTSSWFLFAGEDDVLIHINLNTLNVTHHILPHSLLSSLRDQTDAMTSTWYYRDKYCMVANGNYVYIIRPLRIIIYDIFMNDWSTEYMEDIISAACAITNDHKYIYTFAYGDHQKGSNIVKYDIASATYKILKTPNLCRYHVAKAVVGANGKIYLHGCYTTSHKTLIFDTNIDQFASETVNIDIPTNKNIPYYRGSQLAVLDDNILVLFHTTGIQYPIFNPTAQAHSMSLYYSVTELISINLTHTISNQSIFPSDGFMIRYSLNDFTNSTKSSYYIIFYSNDTTNNIKASMQLNIVNDECVCNKQIYNCYNCYHHLNLSNYLSPLDNSVHMLTFSPQTDSSYYDFDVLMLPKYISIELERCTIRFENINTTTTSDNPSISFAFNLSSNCYSRNGTRFSLNITATVVNISNELAIQIIDDKTIQCKICENDCFYCTDNRFVLHHATKGLYHTKFEVVIKSNMIDFRVISSNNTVQYFKKDTNILFNDDYLYLLLLLIIPIIIIIISIVYCRQQYMSAYVIDNALVLIIGISQFDDKKQFLKGVPQNVEQLIELWDRNYHYDVFVCNVDTLYCSSADVIDFIDENKKRLTESCYKCVIVHIISHATPDSFITSDNKNLSMEFIMHELTQEMELEDTDNLSPVKIFFHHGCRGSSNYSKPNAGKTNTAINNITEVETTTRGQGFNIYTAINNRETMAMDDISYDSNFLIISGTVVGRSMSDSGNFTKCICEAFETNLGKRIKADFNSLVVEIGVNLERLSKQAELCNINGTLRYKYIRFDKSDRKVQPQYIELPKSDCMHTKNVNLIVTAYIRHFWNGYTSNEVVMIICNYLSYSQIVKSM
eukprot:510574_1